eukprot:6461224-Amphidinium_carterae.1
MVLAGSVRLLPVAPVWPSVAHGRIARILQPERGLQGTGEVVDLCGCVVYLGMVADCSNCTYCMNV